jgi:hypothetical protein
MIFDKNAKPILHGNGDIGGVCIDYKGYDIFCFTNGKIDIGAPVEDECDFAPSNYPSLESAIKWIEENIKERNIGKGISNE